MLRLIIRLKNKFFRTYFFSLEKITLKKFGKASSVNISGATSYQPVDALNFFRTMEKVPKTYKNFYDIGCGAGKALWLAQKLGRFESLTGIDGDKNLVTLAEKNVRKNAKLYLGNATNFHYDTNSTVFFLYNPFDALSLEKFINCIGATEVCIAYLVPIHRDVLLRNGWKSISNNEEHFFEIFTK
jgi:SAM-dependent methyltransferase